ncbi:MAG: hypothetical protein P8M30_07120 [Planctomycetaceae bacterium]|nr:hypothetical protein [Planctomycetaceae bacterium]
MDRDTSFIALRDYLETKTDTEVVLLPPRSPKLNWNKVLFTQMKAGVRAGDRDVSRLDDHLHSNEQSVK